MKQTYIFVCILLFFVATSFSQENNFKIINKIQTTPVKNQSYSGTCWCFATTSFLENELIRNGKGEFDLSEMYTVRKIYHQKFITNVRMQGHNFFTPGGQAHNVMYVLKNFGAVPENEYTGLKAGELLHNHNKLDAQMLKMIKPSEENKDSEQGLTKTRLKKVELILDDYLGEIPQTFIYKNKKYTPKTFYSDVLELNIEDYIEITSFTHQPYYQKFCLHDKYNWASNLYMNVPFDEFFEIIDYALKNGYTVNWNGDVSETGFDFYKGIAKLNINLSEATAELRQEMYDTQKTTVDHLMNIVGTAQNSKGEKFYIIKNSWGTNNPYGGFMYMSEAYLKLKTVSITVHKNAIPKDIYKKIVD